MIKRRPDRLSSPPLFSLLSLRSLFSLNFTPVITFARKSNPLILRQFFSAHIPSLNIMCNMPSELRQPLQRLVRCRIPIEKTYPNVWSTGDSTLSGPTSGTRTMTSLTLSGKRCLIWKRDGLSSVVFGNRSFDRHSVNLLAGHSPYYIRLKIIASPLQDTIPSGQLLS